MITRITSGSLPLGTVVVTPHALNSLSSDEIRAAIKRHEHHDWGEVCESDRRSNNQAVMKGLRILSVYKSGSGDKFWIITEADRSCTTILMPEDY